MVTPQEKEQCLSRLIETKSDAQTHRRYETKCEKNPPSRSSNRPLLKKFMETGSVLDAVRSGRARIFAENSVWSFSYEVHPYCCQRNGITSYKSAQGSTQKVTIVCLEEQMLQRFLPNDKSKRKEFADNMLQRIFKDEEFSQDEELLTASNTDPVSINFLSHGRLKEREGESFPLLVLYLW